MLAAISVEKSNFEFNFRPATKKSEEFFTYFVVIKPATIKINEYNNINIK
ncbi:hypothetical protein GCM10008909_17340 [Hathewaya limosa]